MIGSPLWGRRTLLTAAALVAAGVGTPGARAQGKIEKPRVAIAMDGKSSFPYLPLTIAERLGYFVAEGLDVELQDFPGRSRVIQAVLDGSGDVVGGPFEQIIELQGRKQFLRAFVLLCRAPQVAVGVSTRTMPAYRGLNDLAGRKLAICSPVSLTDSVARLALMRGGVVAQQISFIETGPMATSLAAVRAGQVDAISAIEPLLSILEQKGEVRIIFDTRTLKGSQEVFGGALPAACLFAPLEYVQNNPNTVQALANAVVRSLKWLQTAGPSDIVKVLPDAYPFGDRGLYLSAFGKVREAIAVDGVISSEGVRTAQRMAGRLDGTLNLERIDLERSFTNEFALKAKDKFRA